MKRKRLLSLARYLLGVFFPIITGCATHSPNIKMPESLPPVIREYKHVTLHAGSIFDMKKTGVHLYKGNMYTIIATGSIDLWPSYRAPADFKYHDVRPEHGWPLIARVGESFRFRPLILGVNSVTWSSIEVGELFLGYRDGDVDLYGKPKNPEYYRDNRGSFNVDIIVWKEEDWVQIADFLNKMKERDPQNSAIDYAVEQANSRKRLQLASLKTSELIKKTKQEIQVLKGEPVSKAGPPITEIPQIEPPKAFVEKSKVHDEKEARVAQLEAKLKNLVETLAQLEETKKKFEEEKEKTRQLTEELEEKERREHELMVQLRDGSKTPPVIVITSPKDEGKVEINFIHLSGVAEDEAGLEQIEIFINDKLLKKGTGRGIRLEEVKSLKRLDFKERIPLEKGANRIKIRAIDSDGLSSEKILTVHHIERRKNIWAVVIGINKYPHIRQLKYAVNDARRFYDHLVRYNHIPAENVTLLIDQEANLTQLRSTLGTHLKNKAGKDDMVIIFFAGHGAAEKDAMSPDGDGLEKYLLPYDADPKDLYATALPMGEVSRIFNRIRSERLVFIADSCYSGASGGRTIGITGLRTNISDAFLDRIVSGKGRVIITASGSNEVSAENEDLQHGIFTYYLLEGLRGKADADGDGLITVDEAYRYLSDQVPRATGQEQHPVKKGTVEGRLILGVVE